MACPERNRLLTQFAAAARVYNDATASWQAASETEDTDNYRRSEVARQDARIEFEVARLELDKHCDRHACDTKN